MFLSDGGTDWPEELVTQHCNQSRTGHIKMFTFACGPHPIPTVVLKEMACATGGYFSPITALGSVRVKIQDYVRVLSRPLAFAAIPDLFQWQNFYRDIGVCKKRYIIQRYFRASNIQCNEAAYRVCLL